MVGGTDESLQCKECHRWHHAQYEEECRKLQEKEKELWFCRKCMHRRHRYVEEVKKLKEETEAWEVEQRKLEDQGKLMLESGRRGDEEQSPQGGDVEEKQGPRGEPGSRGEERKNRTLRRGWSH